MRDRRNPEPSVYDAEEVHDVIAGWKREVQSLKEKLQVAYQGRRDDQIERDELREHNRIYGEESLAQLAYIRELTESREAALKGERLARVREDLQRIYVAELLEEIAQLKAKG